MASTRMPQFALAAKSAAGALHVLHVAAPDRQAAVRQAERQGWRVLSCEARRGRIALNRRTSPRRPRLDIALFSHELASLLDAGLGIIDALDTLAEKEKSPDTAHVLERLVQALKEGQTLSTVMAEMPHAFPPLLTASIAAGEQTGGMASALRRYAANFETLRSMRSKALGAAVYPLLLLGVGALVVLFLLGIVVPRFAKLIEASHSDIPFASRLLIELGNAINAQPQVALSLALGAALAGIWAWRRASAAGWNLSFLQRLPVLGQLVRLFRHAQFYRTASMLIEGGIAAVRAFEMCGSLLTPADQHRLRQAVQSMREGAPIGTALQHAGLADPVALRMLTVAQRTGQLADILSRIASFQEITLARAIEVATRLFEPVLMLAIGLIIGAIVVLMYLPIFDLASSLQ